MTDSLPISIPFELVADFCRRNRIQRLALFGSVLRGDFRPDSDIDVLIEFERGVRIGLFGFQGLEMELSKILGRIVDLNTPGFLSDAFKGEVLREARDIHVAA